MLISDKYVLVNAMEEEVRDEVKKVLSTVDMCKCEKCLLDICAIVLNALKPSYTTTEKGALLVKAGSSAPTGHVDMIVEISKAVELVKQAPQH